LPYEFITSDLQAALASVGEPFEDVCRVVTVGYEKHERKLVRCFVVLPKQELGIAKSGLLPPIPRIFGKMY
jgi:hypothetical protein